MEEPDRTGQYTNRTPWFYTAIMVAVAPFGILAGFVLFGQAPCLFYIPGLLLLLFMPILPLAGLIVWRVDIELERIIFVKAYRKIAVEKSNIASFSVFLPLDAIELAKPVLQRRDRRLTFEMIGGEKIAFHTIEAQIAFTIQEDLVEYGIQQVDESELTSPD